VFGSWENDGVCQGTGENPACGPGTQNQRRTCTDGTLETCTVPDDTQRIVTCSVAGTQLPDCPPACANGDVKLEDDGTPLVLWDDVWPPICGHYFWDNQIGATKFCEKMGYQQGEQSGEGEGNHYSKDAFKIGKCKNDDDWNTKCTGGCNDYEVGGKCSNAFIGGNCAQEEGMAMTITCTQPSNAVFNPSCTGKIIYVQFLINNSP
jgi:hypothetical protein